ncbi:DUF2079 domain-containing protein [Yinghuangia soli]|uniref:DUF2079 domain-containing protein n=1 Tax=Yinghuangia soli TaxID=2908204 RepID=A0AA41Q716_9ACTN|nr:DUF2079 domain-containing protein [Yinghuangia soli]MCF2532115.1 DUF2079 domain-containing protein [Yinghuangia soli]
MQQLRIGPITVPGQRGGSKPRPPRDIVAQPAPYLLAIAFFGIYTLISVLRFRRVENPSWDLAIFEQAVKGYAHFQAPIVDVRAPGMNQLGDHFSPILATLAPFYRVFPSPVTLLLAQAVLFALAVIPVTRMAGRILGPRRGVLVGIAYGLSWGVQRAVDFDFHEIAFAVPILAFLLEKLLLRRWLAAALWCLPLLLVKEDLALTVGAVGIYLMLQRQWKLGAAVMAGSAVAMALMVYVLIPGFNPHGVYEQGQAAGGGSLFGIFEGFPKDLVWPFVKVKTLLWVFGAVGFLALRSPLAVVAAPTLVWRLLSDTPNHWGQDWHYSAVLMPMVFMAMLDGIRLAEGSPRPWLRLYARDVVPGVAAASLALCAFLPASRLIEPDEYKTPPRLPAANAALTYIAEGSTVETDLGLISQLPSRAKVYWIGATGGVVPDYIALDQPARWDDKEREALVQAAADRHNGTRYEVVFAHRFVILERVR